MTHHITDEQIGQIAEQVGLVGPASRVGECHAAAHRFARAVLALAAPAQQVEPFGYFRATAFGWEQCAEDDEGAIALYTAPAPAVQGEKLVRFCPGCGSVGDVPDTFRDCCPDGSHARMIPENLAARCHDLFSLALDGVKADTASAAEKGGAA